jgi:hypothetical protein
VRKPQHAIIPGSREDDHHGLRCLSLDLHRHRDPVQVWQLVVDERHLRSVERDHANPFGTGCGDAHNPDVGFI